jgi:hypothetical protein
MGYDLHITRRSEWADDDGPEITLEEWKAYVASDDEVRPDSDNGPTDFLWAAHPQEPWPLCWDRGEINTKNPDETTIRKLVAIANRLSATVQGDDGEIYREDGTSYQRESSTPAPSPAQPGLLTRIASWFRHRRNVRELQSAAPAFRPGQRVKNPWGELGTVLSVDQSANGGLGSVRVRLDDGREQNLSYVASGLEIVGDTAGG